MLLPGRSQCQRIVNGLEHAADGRLAGCKVIFQGRQEGFWSGLGKKRKHVGDSSPGVTFGAANDLTQHVAYDPFGHRGSVIAATWH